MRNPKSNPFEGTPILKKRVVIQPRPRFVSQDVEENGRIVRKIVVEMHDYAVPFTPQSGVSCVQGDLAKMSKLNIDIKHETFYLSNIGTNPIALERLNRSIANSLNSAFEDAEKKDMSNSKND